MSSNLNLDIFKGFTYISRDDLKKYIRNKTNYEKESSIRWVIYHLVKNKKITKVNQHYFFNGYLKEFAPISFNKTKGKIEKVLKDKYPLLDIVIYESSILNEWLNHQISKNIIFVQTEKIYSEYVFDALKENLHNQVLFYPSIKDFDTYAENDTIIVSNFVTRCPQRTSGYDVRLEKLIVDIFSSDLISEFFSQSEYSNIISNIFGQYKIDTKTLVSYAKRRQLDKLMSSFISSYIPGKEEGK